MNLYNNILYFSLLYNMKRYKNKKIPKESKKLKYLYFIVVLFKGDYILKFGISNNYRRRFKEYNNSLTIGYYSKTLAVYRSSNPKRLESMLKWYMNKIDKPLFKYEYFDLKYYGLLQQQMFIFSDIFEIVLNRVE